MSGRNLFDAVVRKTGEDSHEIGALNGGEWKRIRRLDRLRHRSRWERGGTKLLPPAVSHAGLPLSFRGRWKTRMG
jgi:hypothetical protein